MELRFQPALIQEVIDAFIEKTEREGDPTYYEEFHGLADPIYENLPLDEREPEAPGGGGLGGEQQGALAAHGAEEHAARQLVGSCDRQRPALGGRDDELDQRSHHHARWAGVHRQAEHRDDVGVWGVFD